MNRGRGSNRGGGGYRGGSGGGGRGGGRRNASRGSPATPAARQWVARGVVGGGVHLDSASSGTESPESRSESSGKVSIDGVTKKFEDLSSSEHPSQPNFESPGPFNDGDFKGVQNVLETEPKPLNVTYIDPCDDNLIPSLPTNSEPDESSMSIRSESPGKASFNGVLKKFDDLSSSGYPSQPNFESPGPFNDGDFKGVQSVLETEPKPSSVTYIDPCDDSLIPSLPTNSGPDESSMSIRSESSGKASFDGVIKKFDDLSSSEYPSQPNFESPGPFNDGDFKGVQNVLETEPKPSSVTYIDLCYYSLIPLLPTNSGPDESSMSIQASDRSVKNCSPSHFNPTSPQTISCRFSPEVQSGLITSGGTSGKNKVDSSDESSMSIQASDRSVKNCSPSHFNPTSPQTISCRFSPEVQSGLITSGGASGKNKVDSSDSQHDAFSFDICEERSSSVPKLKPSLHIKNKAMRNEKRQMQGDNIKILRPGMILLKGYISLENQVKLVKSCRELGRGPGGFYQPGFSDGAKLHLKMMCLGKNWDPETSRYDDKRPIDQAKPPPIPEEFQKLVKEAISKCHQHLESDHKMKDARKILPPMSPNICIINYYTKTGKLGLHQDKDESPESLKKRLPVVSFSLGDTAEFLFGDERDVDKAEKVELKSGDVLIFGGESRHIFHGVSNIVADTAPKVLLEETRLKPCRLNLTFREY